ncbi:hypothetical protein QUF74_11035 [Candidatus Halobeggiatoa sp. HSG11]|nr:hypothetical protein [Candidatus Halobeggiatoa sp. HSG11]
MRKSYDFSFGTKKLSHIGFIGNFGLPNNTIKHNYSAIQKKDKEQFLNGILKEFDPQIENFKIYR